MKHFFFALLFIAASGHLIAQKSPIYKTNGKAIKGYDAVAFHTQAKPVKGIDQYAVNWQGATWLFSSKANLDLFKASPEKYAPQYGGYCAYGAADGHKAPTEANTWQIINGKLYLNYNQDVKNTFNKKAGEYIQKADKNWVKIKDSD